MESCPRTCSPYRLSAPPTPIPLPPSFWGRLLLEPPGSGSLWGNDIHARPGPPPLPWTEGLRISQLGGTGSFQ